MGRTQWVQMSLRIPPITETFVSFSDAEKEEFLSAFQYELEARYDRSIYELADIVFGRAPDTTGTSS